MQHGKIKLTEFLIQFCATMCISFFGCQTGFISAWPSYTTAVFKSNDTVLSAPMSSLHVSLLGSLSNIGGLAISPFCGYIFNKFGRKYASMLFGLPFVFAWTMISFTNDVVWVLVAITLSGIGCAGQSVSIIFISEIAHDSIRGSLTAVTTTGYFLGLLISYILGGHFSYIQVVHYHLALAVLAIFLLMILKESPVYLVLVGRDKEAAESIAFYQRLDAKSKEVEAEISKIKLQLSPTLETTNDAEANNLINSKRKPGVELKRTESPWRFLMRSKSSQRALFTVLATMSMVVMMGGIIVQVYAEPLFLEAVPSMPPNQCAILVALDFLVASVVCVLVIDRCGRKPLLSVAAALASACSLLLGTQLQFHWAPPYVTVVLIYIYCFLYTAGCSTIPFVLMAEVFLPEVRSLCNGIAMAFMWVVSFVALVIFNPLVYSVGLGPVFYIFACACVVLSAYGRFCLPETKGLSVTEIQKLFNEQ